jgi:hypothetical protein
VVVAAGEEAGTRWRAEGGGVEVRVAEPVGREAVEHRRVEVGAEAAELRETDVVEDDEEDVRRAGRRLAARRPPSR